MKSNILARVGVIALAAALAPALGAGTAQAGWHSNANVAYSGGGTGGGASGISGPQKFTIRLGTTTYTVLCTGSATSSFTLASATGPASGTWTGALTTTLTPTGCRAVGVPATVACTLSFDAVTYNGGTNTTYLNSRGKISTGTIHVHCTFRFGTGAACARMDGTAPGSYQNPSVLIGDLPNPVSTSTDGRYTISSTGQSLAVTTSGSCVLPSGPGTLTSDTGGDYIINLISSSPQPVLWRD